MNKSVTTRTRQRELNAEQSQVPRPRRRTALASGTSGQGRKQDVGVAEIGLRGGVVRNPGHREEQRRQVIAAAGRVFVLKGYEAATMDDIAVEMGVSKGILYYQFQSKQDLIVEARRDASGRALTRLDEIASRSIPVLQRLELAVRSLIETNFDELSRHVILTPVSIGLEPRNLAKVREVEMGYEGLLARLLEEGMSAGVLARAHPRVTAYTVIRTALSPASWFRDDGEVSSHEATEIVTAMVMRAIVVPASVPQTRRKRA